MLHFLIRWLVTAVAVLAAAHIVSGVDYHGNYAALAITALILGILNAFLRPLLLLVTLPLNVLSFGILTLFINAFLFWLAGRLVSEFTVDGFWSAFFGALIVSIVSFFLNSLLVRKGRVEFYHGQSRSPRPPRDDNVIDV
jgi:putative membrane protein